MECLSLILSNQMTRWKVSQLNLSSSHSYFFNSSQNNNSSSLSLSYDQILEFLLFLQHKQRQNNEKQKQEN